MVKVYYLVLGILGLKDRLHSLITVPVATFIVLIVYMTGKSTWLVFEDILTTSTATAKGYSESVSLTSSCDLFSGKWVYDNSTSYPLYSEKQCSFMSDELACEKFGRKDLSYQNWRWQPDQCDLPRFNAKALLERLRGKRMVYVGDSLNRNQWVSMVCLVESVIPSSLKSVHINGSLKIFSAIEYNATIEFYWAPLLVESNSDNPLLHRLPDRIVRAQAIEKHAIHWTDADILVFNSYLWWRRPKMKVLWGSFEHPDEGMYKDMEMLRSYEMALKTWSDWLEIHVNHTKTELFFVSMSPTHTWADEWSTAKEGNCYNETEPISQKHYKGRGSDPNMMNVVEQALDELKVRGVNIKILKVTQLSEYRKEGHPSIHRKQWVPLTQEQTLNPASYSDCTHWCLPGVPDTWNELLYAYIFS
ncbi:protein trichome birefringence-like 34 isoform X1 [Papaver somniferum]|uniref:protein trichome birefringence-like 34 isoform X1 n=2 Tax=Papaver somniferum TaxID=3469 RepID=UPI000E6FE2DB|nr:protein trichome birefringence-like 34 isoform X1 [Papaver somniferum]